MPPPGPSLSLTLGLLCLIGCGSAPVVLKHSAGTPAYYPFSRQVSFIESSTTGETMLRVAGRGHDVPSAMSDARKAGLWYLFYAGDRPLFKQDMRSQGFGDIERQLFLSHADFIRYESGLKSKKRLAGETRIQMVVRYDIAALKKPTQSKRRARINRCRGRNRWASEYWRYRCDGLNGQSNGHSHHARVPPRPSV